MTLTQNVTGVPQYGVFEIELFADSGATDPFFDTAFEVAFHRPDGSTVRAEGFYDGGQRFKARAYASQIGTWRWTARSALSDLNGATGTFEVVASALKGQLKHHPDDPHQFAYDNGEWFLHIGDTGYRYVADTEPEWKAYIDQAAAAGFTKIRTWFSRGRRDVNALFNPQRTTLNLTYWQEIDRRMTYALQNHPEVMFKLIPYGEDTEELKRYAGDALSQWIARYAQARFSAFPNVHWCVSNDRIIVPDGAALEGRKIHKGTIVQIARDMAAREPWGTLLTNHQLRFTGYDFADQDWSDMTILQTLDEVEGTAAKTYRAKVKTPVVLDEDRYEHYRPPTHPRYFFRRFMWANLLSGAHPTYCGAVTFVAYDGNLNGIYGYSDMVRAGKLEGANDFRFIAVFFKDTGITLDGMTPDDAFVGDTPAKFKCLRDESTTIIYLANPNWGEPHGTAFAQAAVPDVTFTLEAAHHMQWFNPRTGEWGAPDSLGAGSQTVSAPGNEDWILLLRKSG